MLCSVCGAPAKNLTPGNFDGLIVSCPHCQQYEVAGPTLNQLLRLALSQRHEVLLRAKRQTPPGQRPIITKDSF
jgi:hypothetical protein